MAQVWDKVVLFTESDLLSEVGSIKTVLQVADAERADLLSRLTIATKREFGELIQSHLPDIYARYPMQGYGWTQWLSYAGYSYTQTDPILNLIRPAAIGGTVGEYTEAQLIATTDVVTIPDLTTTACALFLKRAYTIVGSQMKANVSTATDYADQALLWEDRSEKRWKEAKKRLWIDFGGDGKLVDEKRLRTRRGFQRG